jgi:hypothetical protein
MQPDALLLARYALNRETDAMPAAFDWRLLADMHKPTDPAAIAAEIRRLAATGLKPRDISNTLRLDMGAVLEALREVAA